MNRCGAAVWALAALLLAEAGARTWPLLAGGLVPLAALLLLAALTGRAALPWGGPAPLAAARGSMLPMMATLPAMGAWCSAAGLSPAAMVLLHAGAMVLPPLLMRAPSPAVCRALLLAGGAALLLLPGVQGLMLAATLHAAAAGVACAAPAGARSRAVPLGLAALVLLLGWAVDHHGPAALAAWHGALALAGLLPSRMPALKASRA